MFPDSPQATDPPRASDDHHANMDEPTMTDLRGVLPAQRPPVDATVLEEPTSEVPVIRPPAERRPDGAPDRAEPDQPEPAAEPDPVGSGPADASSATSDSASRTGTASGPDRLDEPDDPEPAAAEPAGTDLTAQTPAAATEVSDMPIPDPAFPHRTSSEMAKMTWQPATAGGLGSPPDSAPASPLAEAEPTSGAGSAQALAPEPPASLAAPAAPAARATDTFPGMPSPSAPASAPPVEPRDAGEPAGAAGALDATEEADLVDPVSPAKPATPTTPISPSGPAPAPPAAERSEPAAGTSRPGDVAESPIALWSDQDADQLRDRWRELQAQFIDDPDTAVAEAKELVTEAVRTLADTLLAAQEELDPYREDGRADTETMRVAMRRYREFLERVLAL